MKITCIALDLDRTTLDERGRLSGANRAAIEEAIENGVHVVVASGRALASLPEDILAIKGIRYAVTSNGAAVNDLHTGECLKQYKLTAASVRRIRELAGGSGAVFEAFLDGEAYADREYVKNPTAFGAAPAAVPYIQSTRIPVDDMEEFLKRHSGGLDCLDVVVGDPEKKERLWRLFQERVADIYITSSVEQLLEISYKDCGKHSGVRFLLERLGLSADGLAAFGDADNDAELLSYAGVGIAVANATEACRCAADYVTRSNEEDGVAYAIRKLLAQNQKLQNGKDD